MDIFRTTAAGLALALTLALCACSRSDLDSRSGPRAATKTAWDEAAELAEAMDLPTLAGQVLIVGATGRGELPDWNRDFLTEVRPGGVVLFGFNIPDDPLALAGYIEALVSAAGGARPFVAIDHEGGPVFRFRHGLTRLPAARDMGLAGEAAAVAAGTAAGGELRALGITMNLAPVVEAADARNERFLGARAWATEPELSGTLSASFMDACQGAGAACVLKHFPGNAAVDPHFGKAVLDAGEDELRARHLVAFRPALARNPAAVMLSHVLVPALDAERPATLSPAIIGLLKGELGFRGIVMTDDMLMDGLGGEQMASANAVAALAAGADMLMFSGGAAIVRARDAIVRAVADGSLSRQRLADAATRILAQKLRFGLLSESASARKGRLDGFSELVARDGAALRAAMGK